MAALKEAKLVEPKTITIREGTTLFRGELEATTSTGWFAFNPQDAELYGDVYQYTAKQDFQLVDMSDKEAVEDMRGCYRIYAAKTEMNAKGFDDAFPKGDGKQVYRDTAWEPDTMVVNMVQWARSVNGQCSDYFKRFRGFGNVIPLPSHDIPGATHHPELFIMDPMEVLRKEGIYARMDPKKKPEKLLERQEARKRAQRKQRPMYESDEEENDAPVRRRRLFDSDSDEEI